LLLFGENYLDGPGVALVRQECRIWEAHGGLAQPDGPNRSVRILSAGIPCPTSPSATASTNGVGPQTYHQDATIFGYVGADLFAGPIQKLFDWNDGNGPATALQAWIASIDLIGTVATVRLELDDWTGYRFTDLFTLLKVDGERKIMNKVFHLHS
jgi:hypothetical protein